MSNKEEHSPVLELNPVESKPTQFMETSQSKERTDESGVVVPILEGGQKKESLSIEEELYRTADERIASFNKVGVAQGKEGVSEPDRQHTTELVNMEEYSDWIAKAKKYTVDKRLEISNDQVIGKKIKVKDIQEDVSTLDGRIKKCRHIILLGPAGMGKTTLIRRIAGHGRKGMLKRLKGKLIIMPDFRNFPTEEDILPSQALLGNMFSDWDSERMKQRYQWMIENPGKVAFLIDSLDTLDFDFEKERSRIAAHHVEASVDVIVHNLLAGDLFPESCIISTSREYKVRNMHPSVRPDRCVILDGLKEESVRDLIDGFLGKSKGEEVKKLIDNKCPDIWPVLTIPVFMVLSLIGFTEKGFKPKTMSGILVKFFSSMLHSPHARVEDIIHVLKKLMPLAFDGICKKRVLFTPEDLKRFDLTPDDVTDLGILIPQSTGTYLSSQLMQNDRFFLYFNHQTGQECLAALNALSLNLPDFKQFIQRDLYKPRFSVVRRLVCGILLDDEVLNAAQALTKVSEVEEKKVALLSSLEEALKRERGGKLLDLFIDLNEGQDGTTELIKSSIKTIDFNFVQLSPSDVQAVSSVMKKCEYLEAVNLNDCNLNEDKMKLITRALLASHLNIYTLNIGDNDLGKAGMLELAKLSKHCKVKSLGTYGCNLDSERLMSFLDGASGMKLSKLYVNNNADIGSEGMFYLGKIVSSCKPDELGVRQCKLKRKHLKRFSEGAGNAKLRKLDVSVSRELGPEGTLLLGKLIKNHEVEDVEAAGCHFESEHIRNLTDGLGNFKVQYLDLNDFLNKPPYTRSLLELLPHVEKKLDLRYWKIFDNQRQELQRKLNEIRSASLTIRLDTELLRASAADHTPGIPLPGAKDRLPRHLILQPKCFATKETKISSIDGGEIRLGGCNIAFPPGSIQNDANVKISVESGTVSDQSDKCTTLSPTLGCDLTHIGLVPGFELDVEIQAYCFSHGPIPVALLNKPLGSEIWVKEKELTLARDRKLKFKISTTSRRYFAFMRGTGLGWLLNFPVTPHLFYNKFGMVRCYLCIDDQLIINDLNAQHELAGFKSDRVRPEPMVAKLGDSIAVELRCENPQISNFGDQDSYIFVSDELFNKGYVQKEFVLKNIPSKTDEDFVKVHFIMKKERPVPESKTTSFRIEWPTLPEKSSESTSIVGTLSDTARATTSYRGADDRKTLSAMKSMNADNEDQKTAEGLSAEIGRRIKTKSTNRNIVGPQGGYVENFGCKLTFPPQSFKRDTEVQLSVIMDFSDCPAGQMPIAPIVHCSPSGKLDRHALLRVESWIFPVEDDILVDVFRKDSENCDWQFVKKVRIGRDRKISFKTDHFSLIGFMRECASRIWNGISQLFKMTTENQIYVGGANHNIACISCLKDDKILNDISVSMTKNNYRPLLPLPETKNVSYNGEIKVKIECTFPQNLEILDDNNHQGVKIVETIFRVPIVSEEQKVVKLFPIRLGNGDLGIYQGMLRMKYTLATEDRNIQHALSTVWPLPKPDPTDVTYIEREFNAYGNIQAGTVMAAEPEANP